jgi:tetrahydromethanopterin S-methyltransferase subunit B
MKFKVVEVTVKNTTVLDQSTNEIIKIDNNTLDLYLKSIVEKVDNYDLVKDDMFNI